MRKKKFRRNKIRPIKIKYWEDVCTVCGARIQTWYCNKCSNFSEKHKTLRFYSKDDHDAFLVQQKLMGYE